LVAIFDPPFTKIHGGPIQWGRITQDCHRFIDPALGINDAADRPVVVSRRPIDPLHVHDAISTSEVRSLEVERILCRSGVVPRLDHFIPHPSFRETDPTLAVFASRGGFFDNN
jgi:hypothetical protein